MESQYEVSTRYGDGTLHITSRALIIEIRKKGIVFHCNPAQMAGTGTGRWRKTRLTWPEDGRLPEFEFTAGRAASRIAAKVRRRHPHLAN